MPFYSVAALTLPFLHNHTLQRPGIGTALQCYDTCRSTPFCDIWLFNKLNSTCLLYERLQQFNAWQLGMREEWESGTKGRNFTLWTDPTYTLPRENRTLLIVNWHWGTNAEKIIAYMVAQAAWFPPDTDVVHATPNPQSSCLINAWSYSGYLSQFSLLIAYAALPGYRGYLLTNDDAYIVWNNLPLAFPHHSWHPADPSYFPVAVERLSSDGPYRWMFRLPGNDEKRAALKMPANIAERAVESLKALGVSPVTHVWRSAGHCDVVYVTARDMPLATHWLQVMSSNGVFLEVAFSSTFNLGAFLPAFHALTARGEHPGLIARNNATIKRFVYQSVNANWKREYPWHYFDRKVAGSIHPTKLSNPDVRVRIFELCSRQSTN